MVEIPEWIRSKWQDIADLVAKLIDIPAALIMFTENEYMEVFISSNTKGNPYRVGDKEKWYGLYCETVIKTQCELNIPNALEDLEWNNNPDIKLGMIAYLGYPINFPNEEPFGTICVLDKKKNIFKDEHKKLLIHFKDILEKDLYLLFQLDIKNKESSETILSQHKEIKKLSTAINQSENVIVITDLDGLVEFVNPKFKQLTGFEPTKIIGKHFKTFITGLHPEEFYREVWQKVTKGETWKGELHNTKKNGNLYWTSVTINPIKNEKHGINNILIQEEDITKRKHSFEQLEYEKNFNNNLIEALPGIFFLYEIIDGKSQLIKWNNNHETLLGYSPKELYRKDALTFFYPEQHEIVQNEINNLFKTKEVKVELEIKHKNGVLIPYSINARTHIIGEKKYFFGIGMDISLEKEKEIELKRAKEEAEQKENLIKKIAENFPNSFISIIEADLTVGFTSGQEFKKLNLNPDSFVGLTLEQIFNDKADYVKGKYMQTFNGQETEFELFINNQHQLYRTFPIFDDDGEVKRILSVVENITEKRKKEQELINAKEKAERNERKLKEAQDLAIIGNWELDLQNNELSWSDQIYKIFGCKPQEFEATYEAFLSFVHPEDRKYVDQAYQTHVKNKTPYNIIHRIKLKNGDVKYVNERCRSEYDKNNKAIRSIGTVADITSETLIKNELKIEKEKAEAKEEQLELIANNFVNGMLYQVAMLDENKRRFNYVSSAVEKMYGCTVKEAMENPDLIYGKLHPDDIGPLIEKEKEALKNMSIFRAESRVFSPDGSIRWAYYISRPRIIDGLVCWDGIELDITDRKHAEEELFKRNNELTTIKEELTNANELLNAVFERVNDGFVAFDKDFNYTYVNSRGAKILGRKPEDLIGKNYWLEFPEAKDTVFAKSYVEAMSTQKYIYIEEYYEHWDKWFTNRIYPSKEGLTIFFSDITGIKKTELELIKAKEKAEESDRLKTEFIQNMSHEIRTPLNGILGFTNFLGHSDITEETKKNYINIINNSGHQLLTIIDDILEISQLGTKQVEAFDNKVVLNDLIYELFLIFDLKAKENKIPLYLNKGLSDKESTIITDEKKLKRILNNFLENALKFTSEGFIEFGYQLKKDLKPNQIEIYVKDTGIGIKKESQEIIFKRFSQEEKDLSKQVGGLGLGLSIAKENAELINGEITLESEKGKGTTFFLTIPYNSVYMESRNTGEDSIKKTPSLKSEKIIVLIAEDEEINYLYLETLLENEFGLNYEAIHAKNGKEAVEIFKNRDDIDLVLMDLKMPEMNGFEATKLIRKLNVNIPVIAQTAYTSKNDKDKASLVGCNEFLTKPIEEEQFSEVLKKYIN